MGDNTPASASADANPSPPLQPKFSLDTLFREIFACEEAASFLFSKEQVPPTSISLEMMQDSITINSLLASDADTAALVMKRARDARLYEDLFEDDDSNHNSWNKNFNDATPAQTEQMVFIRHSMSDTCCLLSCTDDRTPLAFMEKAGSTLPGVRRVVVMKLKHADMPSAHVQIANYVMPDSDGRSGITILCYSLEPKLYSEKHFLLLKPYPSYRYPKVSDVLESMVVIEEKFCPYCTMRGYKQCECSPSMLQRLIPPIPSMDHRDPWQLFCFHWRYEQGMKKYTGVLKNYQHNVSVTVPIYHQITPTWRTSETHVAGYQHYLRTIKPYIDSQMIGWGNIKLIARAQQLHQLSIGCSPEVSVDPMTDTYCKASVEEVVEALDISSRELSLSGESRSKGKRRSVEIDCNQLDAQQPSKSRRVDELGNLLIVSADDSLGIHSQKGNLCAGSQQGSQPSGRLEHSQSKINTLEMDAGQTRSMKSLQVVEPAAVHGGVRIYQISGESRIASAIQEPLITLEDQDEEQASGEDDERTGMNGQEIIADARGGQPDNDTIAHFLKDLEDSFWPNGQRRNCEFCNVAFNRKHDLKRHIKAKHLEEREFVCECGDSFSRRNHLVAHIKGVHEKSIHLNCQYCGKEYTNDSSLRKHVKRNHSQNP